MKILKLWSDVAINTHNIFNVQQKTNHQTLRMRFDEWSSAALQHITTLKITLQTVVLDSETFQLLSFYMLLCFTCSAVLVRVEGGLGRGGGGASRCAKRINASNKQKQEWMDLWRWDGLWRRTNSWRKLIHLQQTDLHLQLGDRISREGDREHWCACLCVFVCSPRVYFGLAGRRRSQGVAYQKDYPSAGKYCRYKGQVFFGGEGSKSVLTEQPGCKNWD